MDVVPLAPPPFVGAIPPCIVLSCLLFCYLLVHGFSSLEIVVRDASNNFL